MVASKHSQKARKEETTVRRATVFALGALEKQVSIFKSEKVSLKNLNRALMQNALPASQKSTEKYLNSPFPLFYAGVLGIFFKIYGLSR